MMYTSFVLGKAGCSEIAGLRMHLLGGDSSEFSRFRIAFEDARAADVTGGR